MRGAKKQRAILEEQRAFRQEWITCEQGVEHKRKHWLRFDSERRLLFCDACIKFGKKNAFTKGCDSIRLDRLREHHAAGETNGHADAMFKLLNAEKLAADFAVAAINQILSEQDGMFALMRNAYWLAKEMVANAKFK